MTQSIKITGDGSQYVGKRLLVGITHQNADGEVTGHEQFVGRIIEADEQKLVVERADTLVKVTLPPHLQPAPQGEYKLQSSGEVIVNPDYLVTMIMKKRNPPGG